MKEFSAGVSRIVEYRVPVSFGAPTVIGIAAREPNSDGMAKIGVNPDSSGSTSSLASSGLAYASGAPSGSLGRPALG